MAKKIDFKNYRIFSSEDFISKMINEYPANIKNIIAIYLIGSHLSYKLV